MPSTKMSGSNTATPSKQQVAEIVKHAQSWLNQHEVIQKVQSVNDNIAKMFGVKPIWVPIGLLTVVFFFFGIFDKLITCIVGFSYPAWMSFKAIETPGGADDKQWLTYWVVFSAFYVGETIAFFFLSWIPFYWLLKLVALFWLFHPASQGATLVYQNVIQPLFLKYQATIDSFIEKIFRRLENIAKDVVDKQD